MVSCRQEDRSTFKEILEFPWMKEIVDLNEAKYKNLEDSALKEFKEREIKILEKNGVVNMKETNNEKIAGLNRGASNESKFFELDLTPKYSVKRGFNMRHFIKIIEK